MDWYVYGRDQAILARQIYHEPSLLWTDPQQLRGAAGPSDHNPHDDVDDQVPKIVDESAAKGEDAKKNTTVAYFQTQEDAVEAVNSLSYYGLPGTSDSRFRNLIAYTVATHPLLATCFVSRYDYYTRFRRLAALVCSYCISLMIFLFMSFIFSETALITCETGCDVTVPCNRTDLTRRLDVFWEEGSMCCKDNCVLWFEKTFEDNNVFEFIPDFCQGESYSYSMEHFGAVEELPSHETHRTEVTVSLWEYSCDGGTQSLTSFELILISSCFAFPLNLFLGYVATWGKKNPKQYWNKCTKASWLFAGASISYGCCLVMIVTVLANLEGFVAPEHYLPVDNVGNRRQARLFTSAFELLWYGWIMWLAKNVPSHFVFYFIKKKHFIEKYPELVSIEPSEFDKSGDGASSRGSPPQPTYELPQAAAAEQRRTYAVTVPQNCFPGMAITFQPPGEQLSFSCQVPHGVKQGDTFQVVI
ncbi:hypothetical protein TrRE_jg8427 [Triparma retinervis]|uniref:Uncharacterized protein n=1 Tax=Triparma retinervis TaxID=2557542 RepID=A0A9W7CKW4_9STRA|nr:hypothetical protein TrRE_jg8427 [Triparma retinervis]